MKKQNYTDPKSNPFFCVFFYSNSNLSLLIVYSSSTSSSTSINKAKHFFAFIKRDKLRYLKTPLTVTLTKRIELLKFLNQSVCFDENNNNKQTNKTCYHWLDMQIVNRVVQKFEHGKCQQGFPLLDLISFSKVSNIWS